MTRTRCFLLFALLVGACADGDFLATSQEAITGPPNTNGFTRGFARIEVGGNGVYHSGLVLASNLVFVHSDWVTGVAPSSIAVVQYDPSGAKTTTTGRFVNVLPQGGAVVQTVDALNLVGLPIDTANPTQSPRTLTCVGFTVFQGRELEVDAQMDVTGVTNGDLDVRGTSSASTLSSADVGVPCIDPDPMVRKSVGYVVYDGQTVRVRPYANLSDVIDNMKLLATVRAPGKQGVYIKTDLQYVASQPPLFRRVNMCLDVAWADVYIDDVNYYPCHGASNQLWWIDTSIDANNPRLVNDASGMCLDVTNASTTSGQNLQQYYCHNGTNQRFTMTFWPQQTSVFPTLKRISPLSAPSLCLSVESWSYNNARPTEQRTCLLPNGSYDQRWLLTTTP
jgi:hypothetical protein